MDVQTKTVVALGGSFLLLTLYYLQIRLKNRSDRKARRFKTRPINCNRKRKGFFITTLLPMKHVDPEQFFKYTRMNLKVYQQFCDLLKPYFHVRLQTPDAITFEERVAVTLHYLSQGSSMQTIAWKYQMGLATVHKIIIEMCNVIWKALMPIYLKSPDNAEEWLAISKDFFERWNFPNCLGAIDGKHINIQAPANSGSQYFNYKKTFSIVLLACADAKYKFVLVDIGAYGSGSDGGVFRDSVFGQSFDRDDIHVPAPANLPGTNIAVPYVLVADEAFPLKNYIMRPFPGRNLLLQQKIYNYRLSRARRIVENCFGILVARWRILKTTINAKVDTIDKIVKATVCLHNFLQIENQSQYCPHGFVDSPDLSDGQWRQETDGLRSVGRVAANNPQRTSAEIRNAFMNYFSSPQGAVPWQIDRVQEGREPQI